MEIGTNALLRVRMHSAGAASPNEPSANGFDIWRYSRSVGRWAVIAGSRRAVQASEAVKEVGRVARSK